MADFSVKSINWQLYLQSIQEKNIRMLSRSISLVENGVSGYEQLLAALPHHDNIPVIGITGPPGAGKSTLTDALIGEWIGRGKTVAVLCIDPSSAFHGGALLGDRIRMSEWYTHPSVFIRSLAARGSLGGLHPGILEITDLLKAARFDCILIETVGVGQNEIEIAGLADTTLVVLVPEAGDEIQTMKAGLMEIADIFVVNKSDRPDADLFVRTLRLMLSPAFHRPGRETAIVKTIASQKQGLEELMQKIEESLGHHQVTDKKYRLLTERAYYLISKKRMKDVDKEEMNKKISRQAAAGKFNLYQFVNTY
jgi:LAO/AO transport system kinase